MRRLWLLAASVILLTPLCSPALRTSLETPKFDITQPTILAFFRPSSHMEVPGTGANDALSDFQTYLKRAGVPLGKAGIDVHEIYARSFQVGDSGKTTTFQTRKIGIGYYFVSPGKKPRVEYGLMSDADLIRVAGEYFGVTIK
jgi:hypothetical protein